MPILLALLTLCTQATAADSAPQDREYAFNLAAHYDLETAATAGAALNRMSMDAYGYGIRPHLSPGLDGVIGTAWSFAFTYSTVLWPHEFGHWSRAQQVDSQFIFHSANPILPNTTVSMPDTASYADSALLSVGGFEVNAIMARRAQVNFYEQGGGWSDELSHAMINELFFPIYAVIFPSQADDPQTWLNTRGDPVHFVLPVYQRATGRAPVSDDGTVDPELAQFYRESVLLSVAWAALDPGMVQQAMAMSDGPFDRRDAWMPIRTEQFAWTWGTQFMPTPLGYALALNQYFLVGERTFEVTAHLGRPMKNRGLRVASPDLIDSPHLRLGLAVDVWDQDDHGVGISAIPTLGVRVSEHLSVQASAGYKTEGYVLGRAVEAGPHLRAGLSYRFAHVEPAN